jgi:hypothetical protein
MITAEKQNAKEYLDGLGVKFSFRQDWNDNAFMTWANSNHFRVRISYQGRTMNTWFYQGQGVKGDPTIDGVIECLLMDRSCALNGLKEFGLEFGWDKHTLETFKACVAIGKKLERVFGVEVLDKLDQIINGY